MPDPLAPGVHIEELPFRFPFARSSADQHHGLRCYHWARSAFGTCGHLAGVYAQTDAVRGIWIARTNVCLSGVTALSQDLTPAEANALNSLGVDVIQSILGRGITVTGDRTTR
jgi:phage tail sheath protein FI